MLTRTPTRSRANSFASLDGGINRDLIEMILDDPNAVDSAGGGRRRTFSHGSAR